MNVLGGGTSIYFIVILTTFYQELLSVDCFRNLKEPNKSKSRCELAGAVPFEEVHCTRESETDLVCTDIDIEREDLRSRHARSNNNLQLTHTEDFDVIKYHYNKPKDIQYVCDSRNDYKINGGVGTRKLAAVEEEEIREPNIESPHCVINVFLPKDRNETMPGDLVDFVCMTYGGNPLPKVKLFHGDVELAAIDQTFDDTVQFYYRKNVYEEDNGLAFSCVMDTPALKSQRVCTAQALLIPPTADVAPTRFNGLLGETVTFTCNAEGIPSIVSYTWKTTPLNAMRKMGKRLQISNDRTSVTVRNLKRQDHKVRFYCTVATENGLTAESRGKIWLDLPTTTMPPTTTVLTTTQKTTRKQTTTAMQRISSLVDTADIGPAIAITQTPKDGTGQVPKLRTMLPPRLPQMTTEPPVNATDVGSVIPEDDVSITQRIIVIVVLCLLFLFILVCLIIWITYRKFKYTKPRSKLTLDQIVIVKPRVHHDVHTDRDDYAVPEVPDDVDDSGLYSPLRPSSNEAGLFVSRECENNNTIDEPDSPIYATPMTKRKDPEGSETPNDDEMCHDPTAIQNGGVTYATCMKQMYKNKLSTKECSSFEELFKNFDNTQRRLFSSQSLSSLLFSEDADGYLAPSIAGSQANIPPSDKPVKSKIERSKSFAAPPSEPIYTSLDTLLDSNKPIDVQFTKANHTSSPSKAAVVVESKNTQPKKTDQQPAVPKNEPSKITRPKTLPKEPPKVAKKPVNRNKSSNEYSQIQRKRPKAPQEASYLSFSPMFSPEKPSYVPRKPASFIS
ncbi:uncharacterized protein [Antedon mediterranea]|uniref:uncharacterized protein n=1 Tax=Antedon mediterranea TaxID=105859 RepID=UPI003AF654FB